MRLPSILKSIFNRDKESVSETQPVFGWADMHSHLLPGIDDGSSNMDETLALLEKYEKAGCRKLVTTPHVMGDFYKNTTEIILGKLEEVRAAAKARGINITIDASAEYYMDEFFSNLVKTGDLLTFGKKYVLVETGFISEPPNFKQDIFNLQVAGYQPVLAHPERYLYLHDNTEMLHRLADSGILLQMNVMSLSGYYSARIKKVAEYMVTNNLVSFIGSDIHNSKHFDVVMQSMKTPMYNKLPHDKLHNNNLQ